MELEYIYMLRFLLRDETCELPVVLWRNEAVSSPENQTKNQCLSQDLDFFKKRIY